ncbi:MAG: hypothetical protein GXP40_02780 [Chloroflexi bacterium]|nr:hypothetical protein [Chloroflexota bacterium]
MNKRHFLLFLAGLVLAGVIQACSAAAYGPPPGTEGAGPEEPAAPAATQIFPATPTAVALLEPTALPAIPEQRRLTLEWPPTIRAGDADVIRLTLEVDEMGNLTPTAEIEGHAISGETVSIPNLYETHNVIAEARLDMAGVIVTPAGQVSEPLLPGKPVTFYWSVRPAEMGRYRGTVWLYLRFIPKEGGEEMRRTLSAQVIEIQAVTLFGLTAGPARFAGTVGSFVGAVLGFPFIDDVFRWLWRKLKR